MSAMGCLLPISVDKRKGTDASCHQDYGRREGLKQGVQMPLKESSMTACIIGWAHTPFGRLENESVESLVVSAATAALDDAGIAAGDVDEVLLGHFNAGFSAQDFTASLVLQ